MADIAVQITYKLNDVTQRLLIDTVQDVNVQSSSSLTNHPIVNGDMIADHMYKEPVVISMSGMFSLNGGMGLVVSAAGAKLANIETMFEQIKDNAVMCDIVKLSISSNSRGVRFLHRSNMVLTNIVWTEKVNSLGFSFTFTQALVATIQEYDVNIDDDYLPNVSEPASMNFTDAVIDWNYVTAAVVKSGTELGFIQEQFLQDIQAIGATTAASILAGLGFGAMSVTVIASICGGLSCIPVAGWVAAGVVAVATAVVVFIVGIVKLIKSSNERKKFVEAAFKHYEDDEKNRKEVERFYKFVGSIHQNLMQLNDAIHCYQIGANEEQEAMVSIDNNYYLFTFTKNTTRTYTLVCTDFDNARVGQLSVCSSAPTSFNDCSKSNALFRAAGSGAYVFLVRVENTENADPNDLTNYFIVSTTLDPDKFETTVTEIIRNAILR